MSGGSDLIQTAAREAVSGQVTFQLYRRTSLAAQWIRIRPPVQGAWVPPLAQEGRTCPTAVEPASLEPVLQQEKKPVP